MKFVSFPDVLDVHLPLTFVRPKRRKAPKPVAETKPLSFQMWTCFHAERRPGQDQCPTCGAMLEQIRMMEDFKSHI